MDLVCRFERRLVHLVLQLCLAILLVFAVSRDTVWAAEDEIIRLLVEPLHVELLGSRSTARLLVSGLFQDGALHDLTRMASYRSRDPQVVGIGASGKLVPRANGDTKIIARYGQLVADVKVTVRGIGQPDPVDFRTEVIGALSRGGCNQGACHGSPHGKNGFRLSLRGFQPELDYITLTREVFGRRANPQNPTESLLLRKATAQVPHQGGRRFREDNPAFKSLRKWIAEGMRDSESNPGLSRLEVLPQHRTLHTSSPSQQIIVRAHFDDGTIQDVTHLAVFDTNDEAASKVSADGLVEFHGTAEIAILVRYLDQLASVLLTYVRRDPQFAFSEPGLVNDIDRLVFSKHRQLQLQPTQAASDAAFLRRVYLDTIGVPPSADEVRTFLDSGKPTHREELIERLLKRSEFAYFWALKWADIMRGNREAITQRGVHVLHRYLVNNFAADRPFDQVVHEILTSVGNTIHNPAANFYRISRTPEEAAESTAQLFLGTRIQCAKCHNHPYESITQNDYYGFASYFARVRLKGQRFGRDDEIVYLDRTGELKHPATQQVVAPAAFGQATDEIGSEADRREKLADWLIHPDNPYFAQSTVNRIWYHLFGRGIVEPIDDFRDSNPPANAELLDALATDFIKEGFRFKPIIRKILNSHTYQLSAEPALQSRYAADTKKYFTHAVVRLLSAEQLLDAIAAATGVPQEFPGYPLGTPAIALAEGSIENNFLKAFSRPVRDVACDCARETEPSLNQVIHLINNPHILDKIESPEGLLGRLLAANKSVPEIIETVFLATISRRPSVVELELAQRHVESINSQVEGLRDLQHALINSNEFLLRH